MQLRTLLTAWRDAAATIAAHRRLMLRLWMRHSLARQAYVFRTWSNACQLARALGARDSHHQTLNDVQTTRLVFLSWQRLAAGRRARARLLVALTRRRELRGAAESFGAWRDAARSGAVRVRLLRGVVARWSRNGQVRQMP